MKTTTLSDFTSQSTALCSFSIVQGDNAKRIGWLICQSSAIKQLQNKTATKTQQDSRRTVRPVMLWPSLPEVTELPDAHKKR